MTNEINDTNPDRAETRAPYETPKLHVLSAHDTQSGFAGAFEASNPTFTPQAFLQSS